MKRTVYVRRRGQGCFIPPRFSHVLCFLGTKIVTLTWYPLIGNSRSKEKPKNLCIVAVCCFFLWFSIGTCRRTLLREQPMFFLFSPSVKQVVFWVFWTPRQNFYKRSRWLFLNSALSFSFIRDSVVLFPLSFCPLVWELSFGLLPSPRFVRHSPPPGWRHFLACFPKVFHVPTKQVPLLRVLPSTPPQYWAPPGFCDMTPPTLSSPNGCLPLFLSG